MLIRGWTGAKAGNTPEQNEDAWAAQRIEDGEGDPCVTVAVADGATEAVYSGAWARALVSGVESDWPLLADETLEARVTALRAGFRPLDPDATTPWYVRNKYLTQGSQAALIALSISAYASKWTARAVAVGDCCVLGVSPAGVVAFPIRGSAEFGTRPDLVCSRPQEPTTFERAELSGGRDDLLIALSDATGKWALECLETGRGESLFQTIRRLVAAEFQPSEAAIYDEAAPPQHTPEPERHPSLFRRLFTSLGFGPPIAPRDPVEMASPAGLPPEEPLEFETFLEAQRAPSAEPRIRNDDATLVVVAPCLPDDDTGLAGLAALLRRYALAPPVIPAGSPAMSRLS